MNNINKNGYSDIDNLKMLSIFLDSTEIGMYAADYYSCEVLFVNRRLLSFTNTESTDRYVGSPCWKIINKNFNNRCPFCPYKNLVVSEDKSTLSYTWELHSAEQNIWLKVNNKLITWLDGRLIHLVTFYDISEMKVIHEQMANLAYIDRFLQINNTLKLEKDISIAIQKPSLVIFDIDSLKSINETYGRSIGDRLLTAIKDWVISENSSNSSQFYRIGDDEFCIAYNNQDKELPLKFAENIINRFREPWEFELGEDILSIFCNASIAVINSEYLRDDEPLLNLIDRTLEVAKEKNEVTIYDADLDNKFRERLRFEAHLRKCIQEGMTGFDVYYQPIVDTSIGTWCGIEALCRWNSPVFGNISPFEFVPVAERLGLVGTLGLWVLETAIGKCKHWGLDQVNGFLLDVNASAVQFLDDNFKDKVDSILKNHNYPCNKLCLEITEGTCFNINSLTLNTLNQLRQEQISVALDDFGTGYANFHQLKNIPVDIIKIERAFITDIESDTYQQYLLSMIIELAHCSNISLIVEGVETLSQLNVVNEKGANRIQGYLFSKPLSSADLEKHLVNFYN